MATGILQTYISKITNLRRDRAHGSPALHQPLLLLTVIELIEHGYILDNKIFLTPELQQTFKKYCLAVKNDPLNIAMPFFHLKNSKPDDDPFWHLQPNVGAEAELRNRGKVNSMSWLHKVVAYACLDAPLFLLLTEPQDRECIRQVLIDAYLSEVKPEITNFIEAQQKMREQEIEVYSESLLENTKHPFSLYNPDKKMVSIQREMPVRSAGFRQAIMQIYEYTCAVCRLRMCIDGKSITDAAHILPFHQFHNDDVRNGISLCKSHHWAFDAGLISLNDDYQIIISRAIPHQESTESVLSVFSHKPIFRPKHVQQYPAKEALVWHRENVFSR